MSGVIANRPEAKTLTRSESGISVTGGDGSKRQRSGGNSGSSKRVRRGQSGADGLPSRREPSAGTMLAGKVLPEVVSLVCSTLIAAAAKSAVAAEQRAFLLVRRRPP